MKTMTANLGDKLQALINDFQTKQNYIAQLEIKTCQEEVAIEEYTRQLESARNRNEESSERLHILRRVSR